MAQHQQLHDRYEFLPLCDVLFNIVSLASYFCDIVFDFAMVYALANHTSTIPGLFPLSIALIGTSLLVSQIISVRWYLWGARGRLTVNSITSCNVGEKKNYGSWTLWCVLLLHSMQVGVLWRYFKLFIPVNLTYVKHEVRELCVLRLVHAFCEAAPMLLLQLYVISASIPIDQTSSSLKSKDPLHPESHKLTKLTAISAGLSLWSVCWAVASFSKGAARLRNLERLVLTWLGVLAQLAWRLGTISARVGALIAYASLYGGQWLVIVMALHWLSMFSWLLLTPDGLFHGGESLKTIRKIILASLLAFVYIFAYINLHETNHRQKMVIFYTVMFLENSLLVGVWVVGVNGRIPRDHPDPLFLVLTLLSLFFGGMLFMGLYYRFFHVRRLGYDATDPKKSDKKENGLGIKREKISNGGIPGVFNCRFANPTGINQNRKKKKPTSFVPPPPPQEAVPGQGNPVVDGKSWTGVNNSTRQLIPFWKKAVPISAGIQTDGVSGHKHPPESTSSVNLIREKLREKKQQQLRELREIQEEMKEGKLFPSSPTSPSAIHSATLESTKQPPPNKKLHTSPSSPIFSSVGINLSSWPPVKMHCLLPPPPTTPYYSNAHGASSWRARERADTPEILLAPRCLQHHYGHWSPTGIVGHRLHAVRNCAEENSKREPDVEGEISDLEGSQVSLPRSYTLPREFKYNHPNSTAKDRERRGPCKMAPSRFYLPSTNSSDGDVDSADNEEETDSELQFCVKSDVNSYNDAQQQQQYRLIFDSNLKNELVDFCTNNSHGMMRANQLFRNRVKHETKL